MWVSIRSTFPMALYTPAPSATLRTLEAMLPVMVEPVEVNVPAFHTPVPVELPPGQASTWQSGLGDQSRLGTSDLCPGPYSWGTCS